MAGIDGRRWCSIRRLIPTGLFLMRWCAGPRCDGPPRGLFQSQTLRQADPVAQIDTYWGADVEEEDVSCVIPAIVSLPGDCSMLPSILVTGGAGYVGSHACKALAAAGYRPVVYDSLSRGHRGAVKWGPLVEGDLHDRDRLVAAMRSHRIEAVM